MKFTLSWLKEHLETKADLNEITKTLTALGLEVEEVIDGAAIYKDFVIARTLSVEQHPNADRLRVAQVDIGNGSEPVQVVCGAPNCRADMLGVFAPVGSTIPSNGMVLKASKIRGEASQGMLCSEAELQLSDEHNGIIDLPSDAPVGVSYAQYAGLNDPIIEIALTPNRADCAGVRGIARDLAAAGLGSLKPLAKSDITSDVPCPTKVTITAAAKDSCPQFACVVVRGVKNTASPQWLQQKLRAVGQKPISALVDITNWFSLDQCRPLHVYDRNKLQGGITVDLATGGESLDALNEKAYTLPAGAVTINDDRGVIGLGGIMGGTSTAVDSSTTDVVIECAYFTPSVVRTAGQALNLPSDARYRFERGVDPESVLPGLLQAARMVVELCGGVASAPLIVGAAPEWQRTIRFDPAYTARLGGLEVPTSTQVEILMKLGFEVNDAAEDMLDLAPPSWRGDVEGRADIVEEVLRVVGYEAIAPALPKHEHPVTRAAYTLYQRSKAQARLMLAQRGLQETVTWSFHDEQGAQHFTYPEIAPVRIANPISSDLGVMRQSILPNLLSAAVRSHDKGYPDSTLFEVGPAFHGQMPEQQPQVITALRFGSTSGNWAAAPRPFDVTDSKGDAFAALSAFGFSGEKVQITRDAPSWFHPGKSGTLRLGKTVLGYFGALHPAVCKAYDCESSCVGMEIFMEQIPLAKSKGAGKAYLEKQSLQPVHRDFAFVVSNDTAAGDVLHAVRRADKKLISNVTLFDVYQGKGIPEGHKSLALSVTLQPQNATLTEAHLQSVQDAICKSVEKRTGGTLR